MEVAWPIPLAIRLPAHAENDEKRLDTALFFLNANVPLAIPPRKAASGAT